MRLKSGTKPRSMSGMIVPVMVPVRPQMKMTTFSGVKPPGGRPSRRSKSSRRAGAADGAPVLEAVALYHVEELVAIAEVGRVGRAVEQDPLREIGGGIAAQLAAHHAEKRRRAGAGGDHDADARIVDADGVLDGEHA